MDRWQRNISASSHRSLYLNIYRLADEILAVLQTLGEVTREEGALQFWKPINVTAMAAVDRLEFLLTEVFGAFANIRDGLALIGALYASKKATEISVLSAESWQ